LLCPRQDAQQQISDREALILDDYAYGEPLSAKDTAAADALDDLRTRLEEQQKNEWATYGEAFRANLARAAVELFPSLRVPVKVIVELEWQRDIGLVDTAWDGPEWRLWESARRNTPLPGSGIPLRDYPLMRDVDQVERDAGRTPLARLGACGEVGS